MGLYRVLLANTIYQIWKAADLYRRQKAIHSVVDKNNS